MRLKVFESCAGCASFIILARTFLFLFSRHVVVVSYYKGLRETTALNEIDAIHWFSLDNLRVEDITLVTLANSNS